MLIGARAAQGLAGALMAASSLTIITSSFPPGPKLHRAIGAWAAMNGLGGAAGVLLGGVITQALTWRWILLINPPIAIATAAGRLRGRAQPPPRRSEGASFDFAGALTLTLGQMVLVYGVVEAGLVGWGSTTALGPIILGAGAARRVRRDRDARGVRAARPLQGADQAAPGRQQHRAAVQRGALPDVVRELPLPAAGAGPLAAAHRPHLPADDADDHAGRLARRQAREPLRRALGARRRARHADGRTGAAREDRVERQRRRST